MDEPVACRPTAVIGADEERSGAQPTVEAPPRWIDRLPLRFRTVWLVTFAMIVALATLWNLAQPLFSGADELEHVVKAQSVVRGQFVPPFKSRLTQMMSSEVTAHVPTPDGSCFIAHADIPASCDPGPARTTWEEKKVRTYVGRSPPLPYLLSGAPLALSPGRWGFVWSRMLTSVTGAVFMATAVALAVTRRRPFLFFGILVAMTPSVLASMGVLGSSPLEIGSATLTWVLIVLLADGEPPTLRIMALTAASASALALSRPISFLWAGLAVLALVVLMGPKGARALVRWRGNQAWVGLFAIAFLAALAWFLFLRAHPDPECLARCDGIWTFLREQQDLLQSSLAARLSPVLEQLSGYWRQAIASVGYNEYIGPWWVHLGWTVLIIGMVAVGSLVAGRRHLVVLGGLLVVLFLFPVALQTLYYPRTGIFWQGRYDLPILAGVLVIAASRLDREATRLPGTNRILVFGIPLCAALQLLAFFGSLRRYVVGVDGFLNPFTWGSGWEPPIPALPLLALTAVALAVAYAWFGWLARQAWLGLDRTPPPGGGRAGEHVV